MLFFIVPEEEDFSLWFSSPCRSEFCLHINILRASHFNFRDIHFTLNFRAADGDRKVALPPAAEAYKNK